MKARKVLIVGGADLVGVRLAAALSQHATFQSVLIDRVDDCRDAGFEYIQCNIGDSRVIESVLNKDIDVVVNCVVGDVGTMLSCADGLFTALKRSGIRPLIQLSTYAAYGSSTGLIDETAPLLGDVDAYAAARAKIDQLALSNGAISLRPGIVYGPGSKRWTGQIARLLCKNRLGDLGMAGDGQCNLLYIDNLIAAMVSLIQDPARVTGAVNLCCDERLTWNDYFLQYAKALGSVPVKRLGSRRLSIESKFIAPLLKVANIIEEKVFSGRGRVPELISPSLLRVCAQDITLANGRANSLFGGKWTSVEQGVKQAADWYHAIYKQN